MIIGKWVSQNCRQLLTVLGRGENGSEWRNSSNSCLEHLQRSTCFACQLAAPLGGDGTYKKWNFFRRKLGHCQHVFPFFLIFSCSPWSSSFMPPCAPCHNDPLYHRLLHSPQFYTQWGWQTTGWDLKPQAKLSFSFLGTEGLRHVSECQRAAYHRGATQEPCRSSWL